MIDKNKKVTSESTLTRKPGKNQTKKYQVNKISAKDLIDNSKQNTELKETTTYQSSWAKSVEEELSEMAGRNEKTRTEDDWLDNNKADYKESPWETLKRTQVKKIRKPVVLKDWFGKKQGEESDMTDSSQEEADDWTEIERVKRKKKKTMERKERLKEKKREISTRMMYMVGIGPIPGDAIKYHEKKTKNPEDARKNAVREFLQYYLDYDNEEIRELEILETKTAAKDDIIYCALGKIEDVKELHYRRAASEDESIITRDYIPPQMYARYMAIAKVATLKRSEDKTLKTQLRWGERDIEIFVKTKGMDEPLRKMNLKDFMGENVIPELDNSIKWKAQQNGKPRRKLNFGNKRFERPSLRKENEVRKDETTGGIVRQHSSSSEKSTHKKLRNDREAETEVESSSDTDMEDYETSADV